LTALVAVGQSCSWTLDDRWTLDTYGHLFPRGDDSKVLDAAEQALLA
jgi:hypothetical protein